VIVGQSRVLVLTDLCCSALTDSLLLEAAVLIHWDLPARSLKCFSQRCAALRSAVPSLFKMVAAQQEEKTAGGGGNGNKTDGRCYFFVVENDAASLR